MRAEVTSFLHRLPMFHATLAACVAALLNAGCGGDDSTPAVLATDIPVHLEELLASARIEASEASPELQLPQPVEWRFDQPQPDWKPVVPFHPARQPIKIERTQDALRLTLIEANRYPDNLRTLRALGYIG